MKLHNPHRRMGQLRIAPRLCKPHKETQGEWSSGTTEPRPPRGRHNVFIHGAASLMANGRLGFQPGFHGFDSRPHCDPGSGWIPDFLRRCALPIPELAQLGEEREKWCMQHGISGGVAQTVRALDS